ncbi:MULTISPECIES: endonuclease SmrB [unclassified Pseudoalteromonas]|uniref:endonuclease SmrB n=1 Tax=unclassified Pseudoalteromonas TaxID=194690 RepID=UPI00301424AB
MSKESQHNPEHSDDFAMFRESLAGVKPLKQDQVQLKQAKKKPSVELKQQAKQQQSEFYFSDEYIPDIDTAGTVNYVKPGADRYLAKQLRRGDYAPELILDLHGLNKETVKQELAALVHACKKQHIYCACVVHGVSGGTLKHKVPQYLVQHPDVLAMHQAPLEYGGRGALLILIDLPEDPSFGR